MMLGMLPVPRHPWIRVRGQGRTALAVGAGWRLFGYFFRSSIISLFLPLFLGDGPMWTFLLFQKAVKPKTTNQPNLARSVISHEIFVTSLRRVS